MKKKVVLLIIICTIVVAASGVGIGFAIWRQSMEGTVTIEDDVEIPNRYIVYAPLAANGALLNEPVSLYDQSKDGKISTNPITSLGFLVYYKNTYIKATQPEELLLNNDFFILEYVEYNELEFGPVLTGNLTTEGYYLYTRGEYSVYTNATPEIIAAGVETLYVMDYISYDPNAPGAYGPLRNRDTTSENYFLYYSELPSPTRQDLMGCTSQQLLDGVNLFVIDSTLDPAEEVQPFVNGGTYGSLVTIPATLSGADVHYLSADGTYTIATSDQRLIGDSLYVNLGTEAEPEYEQYSSAEYGIFTYVSNVTQYEFLYYDTATAKYVIAGSNNFLSDTLYLEKVESYAVIGYDGLTGELIVPDTYQPDNISKVYNVTEICASPFPGSYEYSFSGNKLITHVTIGENVRKLSQGVFANMVNLQSITFNGIGSINLSPYAFLGCKNLKNISIPYCTLYSTNLINDERIEISQENYATFNIFEGCPTVTFLFEEE